MYEELAPYYEELFPASDTSVDFMLRYLPESGRALDVACGTGAHARKIAGRGCDVVGVDLDGRMIDLAKEYSARRQTAESHKSSDLSFFACDMLGLERFLGPYRFNLIYCLGNSIVHLPERENVAAFIDSTTNLLFEGGSTIVQIINFDKLESGDIPRFTPLTSGDGRVSFDRRYEIAPEKSAPENATSDAAAKTPSPVRVDFITSLVVDRQIVSNDRTPLIALKKDELVSMFEIAGYADVRSYGGFDGSAWATDAFVTIVVAALS